MPRATGYAIGMWLQVLWRLRRPIGRGAKWVGLTALIMLAFTLLTRESGREWLLSRLHALGAPVYRTQPSPVVIVERLQAMQRLETARQTTLHDVAVEATNGLPVWLAGERLRMRIVAEASAGIDLAKLRPEHVQVSSGRVRLILPRTAAVRNHPARGQRGGATIASEAGWYSVPTPRLSSAPALRRGWRRVRRRCKASCWQKRVRTPPAKSRACSNCWASSRRRLAGKRRRQN
jgi:hypothetical protein